jgi:hypothetical protein
MTFIVADLAICGVIVHYFNFATFYMYIANEIVFLSVYINQRITSWYYVMIEYVVLLHIRAYIMR